MGPSAAKCSGYSCGDRVAGKYQLIRALDGGGMGVLWAAHNVLLDVHVAIKLVRGDSTSATAVARLLREAQAAARIDHPAAIRVFDYEPGDHESDPFIVMELLEGPSLGEVLRRVWRLDSITTVRTLLPIADALAAMHAAGVVHRDVKPENICIARVGEGRVQPKVLDFGVAKLLRSAAVPLTGPGVFAGSPEYVAPEQLTGDEVDARADVWAFSVVLYECITGRRPFTGESIQELYESIMSSVPESITTQLAGDAELNKILMRGLAKSPNARWGSMRELGAALAAWLIDQGVKTDICAGSLSETWLRDVERPSLAPLAPSRSGIRCVPRGEETREARLPRRPRLFRLMTLGLVLAASLVTILADASTGI